MAAVVGVVAAVSVVAIVLQVEDRRAAPTVSIVSNVAIAVYVSGAVASPGIVRLPPDARVNDAVRKAGPTDDADLAMVNLAERLSDGDHVVVPSIARPGRATPVPPSSEIDAASIDINTADAAELDRLPGIGPALAGAIIDYRTAHGPFTSIDSIALVDGISPRMVEGFRPYLIPIT